MDADLHEPPTGPAPHTRRPLAPPRLIDDTATPQDRMRELQAQIDQLRVALAGAEARADTGSKALQEIEAIRNSMLSEREADARALEESRHREREAIKELQTVQVQLAELQKLQAETNARAQSKSQKASQNRKLAKVIADHESTIEQLRKDLTQRDQEISALQRHLLRVEQERIADAATFLDSLKLQEG